jgi:hypothetical protein
LSLDLLLFLVGLKVQKASLLRVPTLLIC